MFMPTVSDASASACSPAYAATDTESTFPQSEAEPAIAPQNLSPQPPLDDFSNDNIRHMLFGTLDAVQRTVHNLHSRGYAEPNDWSPAISTGRCNEVMRILVRRLPIE